jgi:hypothetical protein
MASKEKKQPVREEDPAKGEWIRRFKANPFIFIGTIVILIIVIVAFVLVPAIVPSAGGPQVDLTFGSYDKIPINYVPGNYFAQVQENIARYMQNSINENNYQYMTYQIWREAFEETVMHTAILREMKRAGYTAPEEVVDRNVAQLPQFQENGRFSPSRYRRLDNTSRISLWREVRDSIAESHYREDLAGLRISSKESDFLSNMIARERSFSMTAFPLDSYPNTEVIAYAAAEPDLFRVTHLSKITINSSEREARQVLNSIKDGTKTFEEAAQTQSQDNYADRGGDMGIKMAYELASEVPDAQERETVIATALGEYSPVVKVPTGWAFFRAEEAARPVDIAETANIDKIRSYMREFQRGRMEDWLFAQARELISAVGESGFDSALASKGLLKQNFGPLPVNYGGVTMDYQQKNLFTTLSSQSIPELYPAESNDNFWRVAFSTPIGTPSEPLVVENNVLVLYPEEETVKDAAELEGVHTFYTPWINNNSERSLRSYFINSKRLDDKFIGVFTRYFWNSN